MHCWGGKEKKTVPSRWAEITMFVLFKKDEEEKVGVAYEVCLEKHKIFLKICAKHVGC